MSETSMMSGTDSAVLPKRIPAEQSSPPTVNVLHAPDRPEAPELAAVLDEIRVHVDQIDGLLVATRDGLLVASSTREVEDSSIAAMSAAAIGLAIQFTRLAEVGTPRAALFEGASGHVCVFPVEDSTLLVVFGEPEITTGLFNVAAKQALSLLQNAVRPGL
jgi:predicted regulator of Ras-like GTPase activity (Roadblock/LC7/MglB family)